MSAPKPPKPAAASPFAALAGLRERLPEAPPGADPAPAPLPAIDRTYGGKIVVARTKKGRGGKTVTTVAGIAAQGARLEKIAKELRQALGCGASVEDDVIVVQGEQAPRVRAFLEAKGAKRVVIGS